MCVVCVMCVCVCVVCVRHVSVNTRLYKLYAMSHQLGSWPTDTHVQLYEYTCRHSFSYPHTNFEQLCNECVFSSLVPRLSQLSLGTRTLKDLGMRLGQNQSHPQDFPTHTQEPGNEARSKLDWWRCPHP